MVGFIRNEMNFTSKGESVELDYQFLVHVGRASMTTK